MTNRLHKHAEVPVFLHYNYKHEIYRIRILIVSVLALDLEGGVFNPQSG